jgi:hypothetical protein
MSIVRTGGALDLTTRRAQTGNTVATDRANQVMGSVAIPAITNGVTGTVTLTNAKIKATSIIMVQVRRGTTTPAAGATTFLVIESATPTAGSCVFTVRNLGSAATLSTDYQLWYHIVS